ncbi:MAG: hypothetical protein ACFFD6_07010 [Candidatus Thorarchaeota archaeon]
MAQDDTESKIVDPKKGKTENWQGEYIDVFGHRGRLKLALTTLEEKVSGKYEFVLRTEDKAETKRGDIKGYAKGADIELDLIHNPASNKGKSAEHRHSAKITSAGSFAEKVMVGKAKGLPEANLGGGIWIAWRFKDGK